MNNCSRFLPFEETDRNDIKSLIKELYFSPAVIHKPSEDVIENNFNACLDEKLPLTGYKVVKENCIIGYFILSWSFSTEYGTKCIWLEDLYIKENYRNKGIGTDIFNFIKDNYLSRGYRLRLEVEKNNRKAINFYEKNGLVKSDYFVMETNPKK